jgi:hypothetical protein
VRFLESQLGGILSGLLTIIVVEGYLRARRLFDKRRLRLVLGLSVGECAIACSSLSGLPEPVVAELGIRETTTLGVVEALGLAHLLEMCRRVDAKVNLFPSDQVPVDLGSDLISVGGPVSNPITSFHLNSFCPGFQPYYGDDSVVFPWGKMPDGWLCNGQRFRDSEDEVVGFLVKLTPHITGRPSVVHLAFGRSSTGTAAAAYYLASYYKQIYQTYKSSAYFLALRASRVMGYRSVPLQTADLTPGALRPQGQANGESRRPS